MEILHEDIYRGISCTNEWAWNLNKSNILLRLHRDSLRCQLIQISALSELDRGRSKVQLQNRSTGGDLKFPLDRLHPSDTLWSALDHVEENPRQFRKRCNLHALCPIAVRSDKGPIASSDFFVHEILVIFFPH